jgi:hypothetical protein
MMIPLYNVVQLHVVDVCVGGWVCVCVYTAVTFLTVYYRIIQLIPPPLSLLLSLLFIRSPHHNTIKYVEN